MPPQEQNCPGLERMNQNANIRGGGWGGRSAPSSVGHDGPLVAKREPLIGTGWGRGSRVGEVRSGGVRVLGFQKECQLPNRMYILEPCGESDLA